MEQPQAEQSRLSRSEDLRESREALEQAVRLAEQAARSHIAREQAQRTAAEGRRPEAEPRQPVGAQGEITLLKSALDQTKDLGRRFAATAIRLASEVNELKSDLKLAQEQILEARHHRDMVDAQRQDTQRALIALQAELAQLRDELAAQHANLAQARQTAHAQADAWSDEVNTLREELHRLGTLLVEAQHLHQQAQDEKRMLQASLHAADTRLAQAHEEQRIREELEHALQENARLCEERLAVETDLERAHAALQEKDRALNDALLLVTLTEDSANASELELLRMHRPRREWRAHGATQRRR